MDEASNGRETRRKKLESLYGHYLSLLTYEGNLVSSRFGHAIATQTIFFAAYFVTTTSQYLTPDVKHVVQLVVSACAIASLLVYALILARTSVSATSWRASLSIIEEDDDFWYPAKRTDFQDIDILCSRHRAAQGVKTKQQDAIHAITSTQFKILVWMGKLVRDPADFYAIYFPTFFFLVWLGFLGTSISHVAITTTTPQVNSKSDVQMSPAQSPPPSPSKQKAGSDNVVK